MAVSHAQRQLSGGRAELRPDGLKLIARPASNGPAQIAVHTMAAQQMLGHQFPGKPSGPKQHQIKWLAAGFFRCAIVL